MYANQLQDAIDKATPYSTIKLQDGIYQGNIVINKPLTIIGVSDNVIIDAQNKNSVITIKSSFVNLENLIIRNSGNRMDKIDAGISMIKAQKCKIINCKVYDVLYGIDMYMSSYTLISGNSISSKKIDIPLRGDALKLYYSNNNKITNNIIKNVRDSTLNYSSNNIFTNNHFEKNRFALHIELSKKNIMKNNSFKYNSVGIMLMGAKDTKIVKNTINSSNGAAGIAVMIGDVENLLFQNNTLSYNAKALYIDGKEKERGIKRVIKNNTISYNAEAFHFHASIKDNKIIDNKIFANIEDVVKDTAGIFDSSNIVQYNYWDRYSGFDTDNDGIGDTPYEVYQYADQLWHYNKNVKFYYASPIMTLLNFLSKIAPFIEPNLILKDKKPIYLSF
jgi:nitrous oxidase accessory protein